MGQVSTQREYFQASKLNEIKELYTLPITELIFQAQKIHREKHDNSKVQFCTLANIKSGACPEDCGYCSQSVHNSAEVEIYPLLKKSKVIELAQKAKENGSTRFCLGAAWRSLPPKEFENICELIQAVAKLNLEVCCTLGMLSKEQAEQLARAGLHTYNHNIDTSPNFYSSITSTRTFEERLQTIAHVSQAGIKVCTGGILGMGEELEDRLKFLAVLSSLDPLPDSVPLNLLVPIQGTPLEKQAPLEPLELVKMVALSRIMLPTTKIRLSAGRATLTEEVQAFCFTAGANSIHTGEELLTTKNFGTNRDYQLLEKLNLSVL